MSLSFGLPEVTRQRWLLRNSKLRYEMPFCLFRVRTLLLLPCSRRIQVGFQHYNDHVSPIIYIFILSIHLASIVLLILDRNMDFVSMLAHGWTYQALVSDCLDMRLNRVIIAAPDKPKKSYDLDSKDFFWERNAANPFPQVAEEIDTELHKYKQDAAEITRSTGVSNVNDISQLCATFSYQIAGSGIDLVSSFPQGLVN